QDQHVPVRDIALVDDQEAQARSVDNRENGQQPEPRLPAKPGPSPPTTKEDEDAADVMKTLHELHKDGLGARRQALPGAAVPRDDGAPDGGDEHARSVAFALHGFLGLEKALDTWLVRELPGRRP